MLNGRFFRLLACSTAVAMASGMGSGTALGANGFDAGAVIGGSTGSLAAADGPFAKAVTIPSGATSFDACVKAQNGQVRFADDSGCLPSELPVTLAAGPVTPLEVSRVLAIPAGSGGIYGFIFGGLQCPAGRTLISSGFQLLRFDLKIQESFIGPGFGLPRVAIVNAATIAGTLPEGNIVRMWATCR